MRTSRCSRHRPRDSGLASLPRTGRRGIAPLDLRVVTNAERLAVAAEHDCVHPKRNAPDREPAVSLQRAQRLLAVTLTCRLIRRRDDTAQARLHTAQLDVADANTVDVVFREWLEAIEDEVRAEARHGQRAVKSRVEVIKGAFA